MSVPHVHSSSRPALISLVEEHLTGLIREAVTVQRHCKRARIHLPNDVAATGTTSTSAASNSNNPINSVTSSNSNTTIVMTNSAKEPSAKRRLHADDVNMALQWRGSEKIYATATIGANSSEDRTVYLEDYIKSEMELRPPQEVGLTVHWLAVDGVQPDIPQNPTPTTNTHRSHAVHHVEPDNEEGEGTTSSSFHNNNNNTNMEPDSAEESNASSDGIQVTQLLPRLLSEELQLYFTRITSAIERGSATPSTRQQQDAALSSLSHDSGLQELVPFLVNYVSKSLFQHVGNPDHSCTLVRMARSLLVNPHLHLELHLHQMLPALLTCVVAERLSSTPWGNHWALRREASVALVQACNLFGDDYATLKARVLKTLCEAAGPNRSLPTQYGGFVAISQFGPKAVNAFLLPLAMQYWKTWESTMERTQDLQQRMELQMCQQAMLDALGIFLSQDPTDTPDNLRYPWEDMEETFGDRLVVLSNDEDMEYSLCFV